MDNARLISSSAAERTSLVVVAFRTLFHSPSRPPCTTHYNCLRAHIFLLLAVCAMVVTSTTTRGSESTENSPELLSIYLGEEPVPESVGGEVDGPTVLQSSSILINPLVLDQISPHHAEYDTVEELPIVQMQLFSDVVIDVEFLNAKPRWTFAVAQENEDVGGGIEPVEDGYLIRGTILPPHSGYVVLRARGAGVFGSINVNEIGPIELWRDEEPFHSANLLEHPELIGAVDDDDTWGEGMGIMGGPEEGGVMPTECVGGCDDGCTIDVAMFYTEAAKNHFDQSGDPTEIHDRIETRIDEVNAILVESEIMERSQDLLRIVYIGELDEVDEFDDSIEDTSVVANSETVQRLRYAVRADLVSLWIDPFAETGWSGIAKRPKGISLESESEAFSIVKSHNARIVAHEFGHNFGCRHDRFQDCGCDCNNVCGGGSCWACDAVYDFAFGWHFTIDTNDTEQHHLTVMAYATALSGVSCFHPSIPVLQFSNPEVYYPNEQTGSPTGEAGCADNARVIRGDADHYGMRFLVSQHRTSHDTADTTVMVHSVIDEPPDFEPVLPDAFTGGSSISWEGRYTAFESDATNLVFPSTARQIYSYDRETTLVRRVTVGNDDSMHAVISGDGQLFAFQSRATNLLPGQSIEGTHVYSALRTAPQSNLISRASDTPNPTDPPTVGEFGNDASDHPAVNYDGTHFAYESLADNLVDGDENNLSDIFVGKRSTVIYEHCDPMNEPECADEEAVLQETVRVSVSTSGEEANGPSFRAAISESGRFVVFESEAGNLAPGNTFETRNIFLRDRDELGIGGFDQLDNVVTTRVTVAWNEPSDLPNGDSFGPSISADGNRIAFHSFATNLVDPQDYTLHPNAFSNVYVYDRADDTMILVSVCPSGVQSGHLPSFDASISPDGRFVAFVSYALNLVDDCDAPEQMTGGQVFIRDLEEEVTYWVSDNINGEVPDSASYQPVVSNLGRFVAFGSGASDLVPEPGENVANVFIRDRGQFPCGDLNGDGVVDDKDLEILSLHMGYECSAADLNGSGIVDNGDVDIMNQAMISPAALCADYLD